MNRELLPEEGRAAPLRFRLFVAGSTARSGRAVDHLRELTRGLGDGCEVEIVDVVADPARAASERILATPTLIKESPPPRRRVTGDLSGSDRLLGLVGLARDDSREGSA